MSFGPLLLVLLLTAGLPNVPHLQIPISSSKETLPAHRLAGEAGWRTALDDSSLDVGLSYLVNTSPYLTLSIFFKILPPPPPPTSMEPHESGMVMRSGH